MIAVGLAPKEYNTMRTALVIAAATLMVAPAAFAQSENPSSTSSSDSGAQQSTMQDPASIRTQIQKNLQTAGFTKIQVMPSSFLVRATDKDGNPVMMVVNPDSITAITEVDQGTGATAGQAPNP
jgi:TRAP-type C4-dicarboxylate transport system substrate-binding protein